MSSLLTDKTVLQLIEEVKKRPALWQKSLMEYTDSNLKKELWLEICGVILPGWDKLDSESKMKQGDVILRRWNNLRTCFRREFIAQRKRNSGLPSGRKRIYIYYDNMQFLLPTMEISKLGNKVEIISSDEEDGNEQESDPDTETNISRPISNCRRKIKWQWPKGDNIAMSKIKRTSLQTLKSCDDEDTNFAMSIVPSLRALNPEEKLDAKIRILNVFKELLSQRRK